MATDAQIEALARADHPLAWDRMSDEIKERERAFYRRLLEDAAKYKPKFSANEPADFHDHGVTLSVTDKHAINEANE